MSLSFIKSVLLFTFLLSAGTHAYAQDSFSDAYKQYNKAIENDNTQDAVTYAEQALALGEIKFGEASENAANLKYNLALSLSDNKQGSEAFDVFLSVIEDYARLYGEDSQQHYQAVLDQILTANDFSIKEFDKSTMRLKRALAYAEDVAEEMADRNAQNAGTIYYELASALNKGGLSNEFFRRSEDIHELAEKNLLKKYGENDMRTLEMRFMLGKFSSGKNRKNDAIEYFEQVVTTITNVIDTSHPYELAAHASLVDLYERKGKSDEATEHCLAIGRMKPWDDNIDPVPLFRKNPEYPLDMARRSQDGTVELEFVITSFGFVEDIKVLSKSHGAFAEKGKEALSKWRYAPKIVDGQAVKSHKLKVRLDFTIS